MSASTLNERGIRGLTRTARGASVEVVRLVVTWSASDVTNSTVTVEPAAVTVRSTRPILSAVAP